MPEEPNKRMDELLRKYARQRSEGADFDIHPATRKMLQDEVKRVYGSSDPAPKPRGSWIAMFWPHLAAAMAVALLLAVSLAVFAPGTKSKRSLADNREATEQPALASEDLSEAKKLYFDSADKVTNDFLEGEKLAKDTAGKSERFFSGGGNISAGADRELLELRDKEVKLKGVLQEQDARSAPGAQLPTVTQQRGEPRPAPAHGPAEEVARGFSTPRQTTTDALIAAKEPAPTAPAKADLPQLQEETVTLTAAPPPNLALGAQAELSNIQNLGAALRRDFVVLTNATAAVPAQVTPLWADNFQMEQLGQQVRFTDTAGSSYVGELQSAPTDYFAQETLTRATVTSSPATNVPTPVGNNAYYFRATGLNRTLGKNLVFEGQFFEPTNRVETAARPRAVTTQPLRARRAGSSPAALPTIVGRVVVDGTNAVPIRAISTEP